MPDGICNNIIVFFMKVKEMFLWTFVLFSATIEKNEKG